MAAPLLTFVRSHIEEIFRATERKHFEKLFNEFISEDASIELNGRPILRRSYMEYLWKDHLGNLGNNPRRVLVKEMVEKINHPDVLLQTGDVGIFYEVYADIPGGNLLSINSVNIVVDKKLEGHNKLIDDLEGRRVISVNEVSKVKA